MATISYTAADALKQVVARLGYIAVADTTGADPAAALASVLHLIRGLQATVGEHLENIGGDPNHYDDGSAVASVVGLPGGWSFVWVWDPRADNPTNRPQKVAERLRCPDGNTVDVIVTAPGVLDVVTQRVKDSGG
ncbi:hypothetical protein E3G44_004356 [Mycobacteroides abscessus]|uniref:Uncharacterized protein n=1 Tax=Mycobacteroides abscessus 21 TaxID=1299324 RepID=A0A829PYZ4_9MYCO|nr:hypothetical protein I543_3794 [Mycobacteroides abscessus 21]MBE5496851.1 hypothetical protein [Mycobacteroides abscessus]